MYCKICGQQNCKKHSFLLGKPINIKEFSGSSPPEIFIGKWNYPNVYTGILSPKEHGDTQILSSPELWHENKLSIPEIISLRNKLIYGRTQSYIKMLNTKFLSILSEVAMTHKSVSTEFKLKKPIRKNEEQDSRTPLIPKAAQVESVRLQENVSIKPKIDYLVNDKDAKSTIAIQELEKSGIPTSSIIKLLSAGLLGLKKNRKLVPTRWSITAVDSTLSEKKIEKIKDFPHLNEFQVFHAEYLGNHYEILLIPRFWSFEVIEISQQSLGVWHDFESIFKRKTYADNVSGAYYANRLALTEYLEKIKRQASVIVFREISQEYTAPLGVGILRQTSRAAFLQAPKRFDSLQEALQDIQSRLKLPIQKYTNCSQLIKSMQQTTLNAFKKIQ